MAFNELTSWDACPVPLTVVLTERKEKKPWGLVSTSNTTNAPQLRDLYGTRVAIEERHRQTKLFWDLTSFHSPDFNLVTNQVVFVGLAYTLLQMQLLIEKRPELNRMTGTSVKGQMLPHDNHVIVYAHHYYAFFTLFEYTEIIFACEGEGKKKLRKKMRKFQREFMNGLKKPRPP